jgi:hypothetical protein
MLSLKILELFHESGAISGSTCEIVKKFAVTWGCSGYLALLETHVFEESQLADLLASSMKIDRIYNAASFTIEPDLLQHIPYELSLKFECLPLNYSEPEDRRFEVVFADPTDDFAVAQLRQILGCELSLAVGERSDIVNAINRLYRVELQLPSLGLVNE